MGVNPRRRLASPFNGEAALAEAPTGGKSLRVFADERGATLNTAKSQLKPGEKATPATDYQVFE